MLPDHAAFAWRSDQIYSLAVMVRTCSVPATEGQSTAVTTRLRRGKCRMMFAASCRRTNRMMHVKPSDGTFSDTHMRSL